MLYVFAIVLIGGVCVAGLFGVGALRHRIILRAFALGVVAFPFIFAAFPATSFWVQGQYGIYVVPLIVILVTGFMGTLLPHVSRNSSGPRHRRAPIVFGVHALSVVALVSLSVNSVASFDKAWLVGGSRFLSAWSGPSSVAEQVVRGLEAHGVRSAYAGYWVAYDLDYLSHERLKVTDPNIDRWVAEYYFVHGSKDPAWLFFNPSRLGAAESAFASTPPGPNGYPESFFIAKLNQLRIPFGIRHVGVIDAVVPDRKVSPQEVGIPAPYWR